MSVYRSRDKTAVATLLALAALCVAACGGSDTKRSDQSSNAQPGKGKAAVTIGTKDFTEEFILGELYAGALRAEGYTVNVKRNIGPTEIVDKALTAGKIDA